MISLYSEGVIRQCPGLVGFATYPGNEGKIRSSVMQSRFIGIASLVSTDSIGVQHFQTTSRSSHKGMA
jgi:hypothetical protein